VNFDFFGFFDKKQVTNYAMKKDLPTWIQSFSCFWLRLFSGGLELFSRYTIRKMADN
jgi:hypothetical protein